MRAGDQTGIVGGKWADRLVATTLGCSHMTVAAVRRELEATGGIRQFDRLLGEDGRWRKASPASTKPAPAAAYVRP